MAYRTRSVRRIARNSKRNLFITIIIIAIILYATLNWILPNLIGGVGSIKSFVKPSQKVTSDVSENATLAPPILSIPYEATNTAQINIRGFTAANSKVRIYLDDELKSVAEADETGAFTAKNISLALGKNNIYGKSLDDKDQESLPSKTIQLTYDDEKPKLDITEPDDGKVVQGDRKIKVKGKTEGADKVLVNDSQTILNSDDNFETTLNLNDGQNDISIKAFDKASNVVEVTLKVTFQP